MATLIRQQSVLTSGGERTQWKMRDSVISTFRRLSLFTHSPVCYIDYPTSPLSPLLLPSRPLVRPRIRCSMSDTTLPSETVRVVVKGKVQGVFYRNWTIENATQLRLKGWVRNRRDGSVEALFSGNRDSIKEMEQRCRRGPPDAVVTGLEVFPSNDDPGTGFERKPTV